MLKENNLQLGHNTVNPDIGSESMVGGIML